MASSTHQQNFCLLRMAEDELQVYLDDKLEETGINDISNVEEIYPCAPMQEGIQLSKMVASSPDYNVVATISIDPVRDNDVVDRSLVRRSWQQVVDRHAILRTIFVESVEYGRFSDQIVLLQWTADIREAESLEDFTEVVEFSEHQPAHCLTIAQTNNGGVHCRLEIDHTLTDGISVGIVMRDLARAYIGDLPRTPSPSYSKYIAFLQNGGEDIHLQYWIERLSGAQPCLFPTIESFLGDDAHDAQLAIPVTGLRTSVLHAFCNKLNVTLFNLVQAAWALVLQSYTGMDDVCFGYVIAGRDLPIERVEGIMGPLINTLICRARIGTGNSQSVSGLVQDMKRQSRENLEHQTTSLGSIYGALQLKTRRLFNTAVMFRPLHMDKITNDTVSLSLVGRKSYSEFDITVSLERSDKVEISLQYSPQTITKESVIAIAYSLSQTLTLMPKSAKLPSIKPTPLQHRILI
ncbi:amino acid adenylation domain-containing protein [Colletotrichum asianum]|uniref:Amino acid adenylation domain-containing protein n=1 Tax=Colletotrichum asianum TaxID=702518 RepID=A0A8H3ZLG6_9PEZI|nr:amino acid adenylation domain-containing protein [Colletotrichum asianum]